MRPRTESRSGSVRSGRTTISLAYEQVSDLYSVSFKRSDSCQSINIQALTDCTDPFCSWRGTWRSEPMRTQQKHPKSLQWPTTLSSNRFMGPLFQIWKQRYAAKIHRLLWLIHYICKCTVPSLNMHSHCSRSFRQEQQLALTGWMTAVCSIFIFKVGNRFIS